MKTQRLIKKDFKIFIILLFSCLNLFGQEKQFYLKANSGVHRNTNLLSSIKIDEQGIGPYFAGDVKTSSVGIHYDAGVGYKIKKNLFAEVSFGKYDLQHVHDFDRVIGDVAPKIKLKQSFYQLTIDIGYKVKINEKFYADVFTGLRFIRGKSRVLPDFINQTTGLYYDYNGYESNEFDSAKIAIVVNNTNLFGINLLAGANIGYNINSRFSAYCGLFFESGLKSIITTGAILKEYSTDNSGTVSEKTSTQVAISDGSSIGFNIGIKYNLGK